MRDQVRGKTDFDIHPNGVAKVVRANDRQVIEAGAPIQFEEAVPSIEGSDFTSPQNFCCATAQGTRMRSVASRQT
jgi:hypothetical protein